ncbi:PD-(D/E)XK nuclease family protein [Lacihabitans sp. CS3-21]|uniref:PD-(D/E)XK nuclease family protein n=1 Tax=Lacihabitans sp. CS3-21 TaxID=2487332 RepID=UPI0020CE5AC6|nr:PD-(D/E)XK nuclease family protein [Lacihabitans sp. CS3-21]MCP9748309.1 PD-(D/E)XK nuclease family protein [Lacihabitans sp. CS3-21]
MQSFLELAAKSIFESHNKNDLQNLQVILPSRRAVFFFKKALSELSESPFFAPKIESIDDFILRTADFTTLDNVDLYFEIYGILSKIDPSQSFEKFMSWVPTLLKDFENIDFSLVENPHLLFKYMSEADALSRWELDNDYVFTSTAQSYFSFFDRISEVYEKLNEKLLKDKKCYRGMVYRKVAENPDWLLSNEIKKYYFVGLNALSKSEEKIIETLEKANMSECIWDTDDFYMNSQNKAGKKLRGYKKSGKFGKWNFQNSHLKNSEKKVRIFELNNDSLQSKLIYNLAQEARNQKHVIVVLDENQFLPLLLNIPALQLPFNISIGLPISSSHFSEVLRLLIGCYQNHEHNDDLKIHNSVLSKISDNQIFKSLIINEISLDKFDLLQTKIRASKKLFYDYNWFINQGLSCDLLQNFFRKGSALDCIESLEFILGKFFDIQGSDFRDLEYVFANVLKNKLNLIKEKLRLGIALNLKSFSALIEDLLKNERVPFEGDSDTPLQIMSMLETRCLDFECVTILSFNEGNLPSIKKTNSFFPFDACKIFGLPLYSDQDAIMAYHFFRLMQRAQTLNFLYLNGASEALGNKEKSRFIRQVEVELCIYNPKIKVSYPSVNFKHSENNKSGSDIIVKKESLSQITDFLVNKGLSASSINDYLSCSLRFYWKYILKIKNEDELKSQIGTDVFGTIVHKVLENLDKPYLDSKNPIDKEVLQNQKDEVENQLSLIKNEHKSFDFDSGMNLILISVVKKIIEKYFYKRESEFGGNFKILGIEKELTSIQAINNVELKLKGVIDKIELHPFGLRIIDYKTGKVELKDLHLDKDNDLAETLLNPEKSKLRQLIIYYFLIFSNKTGMEQDFGLKIILEDLQLVIYSFRNLGADISFNKSMFTHNEIIEAVNLLLTKIVSELLSTETCFVQTQDKNQCKYCDFINVCQRN